ncbi:hypothetical protein C0995_009578 [Termitomyces sp. Mi166|nr:hypothetical protein C0995_009578 [Termitomyces sp. Mi166\
MSKVYAFCCLCNGLLGPVSNSGELEERWGGGGPRGPPQQRSVRLQGQITQLHWPQGHQQARSELDYKQRSYVKSRGTERDELHPYQAPAEYPGGLGKVVAYRPPYSQDESTDEGRYERPHYTRSYAGMYMHPVDEALLQHLEHAGQPVPATAAFLQDDLAVMVVEGLLDQIELMRRQRISMLEQIECVSKCKAPAFEEPMVEPKQAKALSWLPQEAAQSSARILARMPPCPVRLGSVASTSRAVHTDSAPAPQIKELEIPAVPLAELSLEASNQVMSDTLAVQQEQKSKAPQAPIASSSKAGPSSQGGA